MDTRRRLNRARRFVARYRRWLAAVLAALTVLAVVRVLAPPSPPTTEVLVATRDLPAGSRLRGDDVRVVAMPESAVAPTTLHSAAAAVGRTVAGPVAAHEMLTAGRLVGRSLVAGLGADQVAAPVRMADADAVRLLQAGDRIDVFAPAPDGLTAPAVVRGALVAALPDPTTDAGHAAGSLVVIAVSSEQASRLAQEASRAPLSFAILG